MSDPRLEQYARLLVERCLDVQPGWQVIVSSTPVARPLIEECVRLIARRGAYALTRIGFSDFGYPGGIPWMTEAPEDVLRELPPAERHIAETADALLGISAPENTRAGSEIPPDRLALSQEAMKPYQDRVVSYDIRWVGCQYPTPALAQDAGMSLNAFEDFLYNACLIDWDEEGRKMQRIADVLDTASEVRIVGAETDLTLSLEGRKGKVDEGYNNMPGGEVFYSPVEDSAEGEIAFAEFPASYGGRELTGIRFRFEGGKIVDASAAAGEEFLVELLDSDEGARRLGEGGFGCNPGIRRHMRNTLFDEKIYGTVHLALGRSFPNLGGRNESRIHWDIVKDIREGGRIEADGKVVQENGEWRF
jgi:aminopeptidase